VNNLIIPLIISPNLPPAVTNIIPNHHIFQGQKLKLINIPDILFYDSEDKPEIVIKHCFSGNTNYLKYSLLKPSINKYQAYISLDEEF
jgi:hypothetical protein